MQGWYTCTCDHRLLSDTHRYHSVIQLKHVPFFFLHLCEVCVGIMFEILRVLAMPRPHTHLLILPDSVSCLPNTRVPSGEVVVCSETDVLHALEGVVEVRMLLTVVYLVNTNHPCVAIVGF